MDGFISKSALPLVLASGSPRRKELLATVVPDFTVELSHVDEDALTDFDPWKTAEILAVAKARAVFQARAARGEPPAIVLAGDTVVALIDPGEETQLAKPTDAEAAVRMLRRLSGRSHVVITALAVCAPESELCKIDTARVTFRVLEEQEIRAYVATGEPMDKAGGYAIQGGASGFVARLEGDIETVIGLPTRLVRKLLDSKHSC